MNSSIFRSLLLAAAIGLAACGGGGGTDVASTPPPPPPPAPPPQAPALVPAATTSQQFAVMGASHATEGNQTPQLGASEQLQVRYVASTNSYEVQLPRSQAWTGISYIPTGEGTPINFGAGGTHLWLRSEGFQYSRLFEWNGNDSIIGYEAVGIATPAGSVPTTGSASYSGPIMGFTPEDNSLDSMFISGSIAMSFNFGSGSLSGNISPILNEGFARHSLGTIAFRNTVFSAGSATFAGDFDTNVAGINKFSGLFTGPNAEEVIGNFALPYRSPIDSQTYQAAGGFVAKGP
jgi:hypothetical protein